MALELFILCENMKFLTGLYCMHNYCFAISIDTYVRHKPNKFKFLTVGIQVAFFCLVSGIQKLYYIIIAWNC